MVFKNNKPRELLSFTYASLMSCWAAGYVYLLIRDFLLGRLFGYNIGSSYRFIDFVLFFGSAKLIWTQAGHRLYDTYAQWQQFNELIAPARVDMTAFLHTLPTYYFPTFYALISPLTPFGLPAAFAAWTIGSVTIGCAGVYILLSNRPEIKAADKRLFLIAVLMTISSWSTIRDGHSGWLLLGMVALFCNCHLRALDLAAGAILAVIACLKPQYALFLSLPVVACRRQKAMLSFLLCFAAEIAIAALITGWEGLLAYPRTLFFAEQSTQVASMYGERMVSLRGALSLFLPQKAAFAISIVLAVAASGALLGIWIKTKKANNAAFSRMLLSFSIIVMLLFSPHSHFFDILLLSVAAALSLPGLSVFEAFSLRPISLRVWTLIYLFYPVLSCIIFLVWEVFPQTAGHALPFFAVLIALFICGANYLRYLATAQSQADS